MIEKIVDLLKKLPDDRSIILGVADREAADIIFMRGDPEALTNIIGVCLEDLGKHLNKEYLN